MNHDLIWHLTAANCLRNFYYSFRKQTVCASVLIDANLTPSCQNLHLVWSALNWMHTSDISCARSRCDHMYVTCKIVFIRYKLQKKIRISTSQRIFRKLLLVYGNDLSFFSTPIESHKEDPSRKLYGKMAITFANYTFMKIWKTKWFHASN